MRWNQLSVKSCRREMERQKYEKKLAEKRANREGGTEEASHVGETGNRTMQRERVERKKKKENE